MTAVIFDIGGVLIDWQPHLAWQEQLGSADAAEAFMARTKFRDLNLRADRGEAFADLAKELDDPEDQALLDAYPKLFSRTIERPVEGTWEVLNDLESQNIELHAITNWSKETWPIGLKVFPKLAEVFGLIVVSGELGITKPNRGIYEALGARAGLALSDCIFIDDSAENVACAKAVGMDAIGFKNADQLRQELEKRGVL